MAFLMRTMAQRSMRSMRSLASTRSVSMMTRTRTAARVLAPQRMTAMRGFASIAENYNYLSYDHYPPHGGVLKERMVKDEAAKSALIADVDHTITMNDRQMCDVELLMTGAFSPLEGFMNETTFDHCVDTYRLPESNLIFGIPVVFDTDDEGIQVGDKILLKSKAGEDVAVMEVDDKFAPNKPKECLKVYGTSSIEHPGTLMVATERGKYYLGGKVHGLNIPKRPFPCKTPAEVREILPSKDGKHVVVFQCRNPVHRAHYELFMRAREADNVDTDDAVVPVHPTVGPTQADDISGEVRYLTYLVLDEQINDPTVKFECVGWLVVRLVGCCRLTWLFVRRVRMVTVYGVRVARCVLRVAWCVAALRAAGGAASLLRVASLLTSFVCCYRAAAAMQVPAVLHAHGRSPRGAHAHDDPQELWLHPLHHRPRHGRLQELPRRRGLLWRIRRARLGHQAQGRTH